MRAQAGAVVLLLASMSAQGAWSAGRSDSIAAMMIPYAQVLGALRTNAMADVLRFFHQLTLAEKVELGTFVGPRRLRDLFALAQGKRNEQASALREIDSQAFGTESAKPATRDDAIAKSVRLALIDVARRQV